ncbi:hypothetical protein TCDM_05692 [Trypanosoma cruzi Dm28c]|uniref:PDZ domain-containing protein n=1 Tax=Trypanosoma cruzi Dm28c TaxID=1416333 RepID=V5BIA8_TRYCR|nr:hypothetical protein TCDM_05692 [Trypanosoma cruzi Dm28c]
MLLYVRFFFFFFATLALFFSTNRKVERKVRGGKLLPGGWHNLKPVPAKKDPMNANDVLTVISPDDGKRFRINIKGDIGRLTIGRLKQCLAAASSYSVPIADQVIKFNGTPLTRDDEVCAAYGIMNGSTLTVEHRANVDPTTDHTASFVSPHRQALEYQTIRRQEEILGDEVLGYDNTLQVKIDQLQDQVEAAEKKKMKIAREKENAERELARLRQQEEVAEKQKRRLTQLREREAQRAARRAADLAARREQLKAEEEATRTVALQKLDNERRRASLEQERAEYEAEKERLAKEREEYEQRAKEREVNIRKKEIEIEQQILAAERDRRELELSRLVSHQNRLLYHERVGRPPPPELTHEGMRRGEWSGNDPFSLPVATPEDKNVAWGKPQEINNNNPPNQQWQLNQKQSYRQSGAPHPSGPIKSEENATANAQFEDSYQNRPRPPRAAENVVKMMLPGRDNFALAHGGNNVYNARENAIDNLVCMGRDLGLENTLEFDNNNTCVISVDGQYNLIVTFDAATERLYIYSTLMTNIPHDPVLRLRVYEFLMEGALLGREMCGGGVGASIKNDFILLSSSIYLPTSLPTTLSTLAPQFLFSLNKWREKLGELLSTVDMQKMTSPSKNGHSTIEDTNELDSRHTPEEKASRRIASSTRSSRTHSTESGAGRPVIGIEATDSVMINGVPSRHNGGVLVVNVGGPAALAGIKPHDIIKKINYKRVTSLRQFQREVSRLIVGKMVPIVVERSDVLHNIFIRVGSA